MAHGYKPHVFDAFRKQVPLCTNMTTWKRTPQLTGKAIAACRLLPVTEWQIYLLRAPRTAAAMPLATTPTAAAANPTPTKPSDCKDTSKLLLVNNNQTLNNISHTRP